MNKKTYKTAFEMYRKNLIAKQDYYGVSKHDLGIALKFINSLENYLDWIEENNLSLEEK